MQTCVPPAIPDARVEQIGNMQWEQAFVPGTFERIHQFMEACKFREMGISPNYPSPLIVKVEEYSVPVQEVLGLGRTILISESGYLNVADETHVGSGIGAGAIVEAARRIGIMDERTLYGLRFVFRTCCDMDTRSIFQANGRAAMEHPALIGEGIASEVADGFLVPRARPVSIPSVLVP